MRASPLNALPVVIASLLVTGISAFAEEGVSADKIVFGQATALEGPASALGQGMKIGLEAAFAEINRAGGIKGRKLELKSVDDGYEPTKSIGVVKKLLEEDKVFAIAGAVGTPTSAATQPIVTAAGTPFIGAFTGAEFLREPYKPLVMNIRASYFQETETMVEHLTNDLGASRIAIMYQDDAFGQAGFAGVKKALDKRKMQLAGEGTFERNTVAVKTALLDIRRAQPDAVIMISPYKPAAEFIKLAKQIKLNATFVNISFVGSDALAKELGPLGAGVVITQVVPFPNDAAIPVVRRYQTSLKAIAPEVSRVGILLNPGNPFHAVWLREARIVAQSLTVQVQAVEARGPEDFDRAFTAMRERAGAVLILGDGMFSLHQPRIADLVAKSRLPTIGSRDMVNTVGLMSYGASGPELFRRAATYVDKILKGAKPADLPVQQPTKYELVINLKTAKALGITIRQSLLLRADEVIE
jgi:ABC-type branched-subunit amino acid transport system substrate-binding protein